MSGAALTVLSYAGAVGLAAVFCLAAAVFILACLLVCTPDDSSEWPS